MVIPMDFIKIAHSNEPITIQMKCAYMYMHVNQLFNVHYIYTKWSGEQQFILDS